MLSHDWIYVDCKYLSYDRMFWVEIQAPDRVHVILKGAYPENIPGGQNARPVLFEETTNDPALHELMSVKNRKRNQKIAEMCKVAVAASQKPQ